MSKPRIEWTSNAGNSLRRSQIDFDRPRHKRDYEYDDENPNNVREPYYDSNARLYDRSGSELGYRVPRSSQERQDEVEREKLLEDFKYNVAKNCTATEKKVYKALELSSDEITRLNNKVDILNKRLYDSQPVDPNEIKDYIDSRLFELNQKNNSAYEELEEQNQKLSFQFDNLK